MSSTIVGLPRVENPIDLDFLEQYIISNVMQRLSMFGMIVKMK